MCWLHRNKFYWNLQTIITSLLLPLSCSFLPSKQKLILTVSFLVYNGCESNFNCQEKKREDEMFSLQFQQQDSKPSIPVSTGCPMSLSRLCSTLTNSSVLRFPSRFVSNKWKTISTTLSERDMPQTCDAARWKSSLVNRPFTFPKLKRANDNGSNFFRSSAKFLKSSNLMRTSLKHGSLFSSSTRSSNLPRWLMSAEATMESAKSLAEIAFRDL